MLVPIVKRIQNINFEVVDFYEIYKHCHIKTKKGEAVIESVNHIDNTITYRPLDDSIKQNFTDDVMETKLMLKSLDNTSNIEIEKIADILMDGKCIGVRRGKDVIMAGDEKNQVIFELKNGDIKFSAYQNESRVELKNLPFAMAHMVKNKYDIYNLIQKGWAIKG